MSSLKAVKERVSVAGAAASGVGTISVLEAGGTSLSQAHTIPPVTVLTQLPSSPFVGTSVGISVTTLSAETSAGVTSVGIEDYWSERPEMSENIWVVISFFISLLNFHKKSKRFK